MIDDLRAEYKKLYGKKPHHKLSEDSLIEAIEKAEEKETKGKAQEEVNQKVSQKVETPVDEVKHQEDIDKQFAEVEKEIAKVKDGKRHLVYKNGQPIWWRESVIEVYLARNGAESLTFPENTQYITDKEIKRCTSCG